MPPSLADIVIDEGLATRDATLRALRGAGERPAVAALVRELHIDEVALVAAIRRRVRVPLADPAGAAAQPDALRLMARDTCRARAVVPLGVSWEQQPGRLDLAMADPTDGAAIDAVEEATGCQVEPALMTLSAIEEMVESAYGGIVTEVVRRDPRAATEPAVPKPGEGAPSADGAAPAVRVRALVDVLVDRRVIAEGEYEEALDRLLRGDGE